MTRHSPSENSGPLPQDGIQAVDFATLFTSEPLATGVFWLGPRPDPLATELLLLILYNPD